MEDIFNYGALSIASNVSGGVPMNKEYILNKISTYLNTQRQLSDQDFEKLFGKLTRRQQFKVVDILIEADIDLIDNFADASTPNFTQNSFKPDILLSGNSGLTRLTNEQLCVIFQQGNKAALDALIKKNSGLIRSRALKYSGRYNHKLDYEDLYQYGLLGLIKAAQRFDIKMDTRLSTYSIFWIDQAILRSIADYGFTVRIPVHYFDLVKYIMGLFSRNPGLTRKQIAERAYEEKGITYDKFVELMVAIENIMSLASLNRFVDDNQDSELVEFIEDEFVPTVEDQVEKKFLKGAISIALDSLNEREKTVIELRFGLNGGKGATLEQVGKKFKVTRERIRQIEQKALRRLRHPSRFRNLKDFYLEG